MKLKPSARQLEFLSWEFGAFFHFGIRTFYPGHLDWDGKEMPLSGFLPRDLNCREWISTIKAAGMRYAVLTAKHHDGFANWPTKYSDYSVAGTAWKDGKGDVVGDFVDACREFGVKVGIYYSPADASGVQKTAQEYDEYFISQISELLTDYGRIDYLWFDGCGSEGHEYDTERIIKVMRTLQPEMLIFNMWDPDTRWVGNEAGISPLPCYYSVSSVDFSVLAKEKEELDKQRFLPPECDARMRYASWFAGAEDEDTVKSVKELVGMYELSVGRGANFLLNIAPGPDGHLLQPDEGRLLEFGQALKERYGSPIAETGYPVPKEEGVFECSLAEKTVISCAVLEEDLTEGQAIRRYQVFGRIPIADQMVLLYDGYQIGHKAICRFPAIKTDRISVHIVEKDGFAVLKRIAVYE